MGKLLNEAIIYAVKKHDSKNRKGTSIPYIVHPLESLTIVASVTDDEELLAAAVLHDTVEDTDATVEDIKELFGERVAKLVASESENKREELPDEETWEIRKQETLDELKKADYDTLLICLSDKLSNIRAIERDYKAIGEDFWQRFNNKDPKKHGWYYGGIAKILGENEKIKATFAYQEYSERVKAVFGG